MEDFFNEVVIFLEEYYVYVIGVGLIIILMLIGLLTSKKKAKEEPKEEEPMVNINDVNTGSINDVANALQSDVMQPVDVISFPEENNVTVNEETAAPIAPVIESVSLNSEMDNPVMEQADTNTNSAIEPLGIGEKPILPIIDPTTAEPDAPAIVPISSIATDDAQISGDVLKDNITTVEPIVEQNNKLEEITPIVDDKFDKTEIFDLSSLEAEKQEDIKPTDFRPFIVDNSQYTDIDNILNGEISSDQQTKTEK